jgi:tetratricopeptide (TPR) repeat protein
MWRGITSLAVLLTASVVHAQETSPQVGQRVVIKYKYPLKIGEVVIEPKEYRAYTVEGTDGDSLWLVSGGVSGWIPRGEVVPLDRAISFYTQETIKNPDSWNAYLYRGFVYDLKRDYDNAIADYTRSIRIYPWWANTFNNRGLSWHCKKEYDKAIADYNEAIRLEPKCVLAIVNRGFAWQDKKEYYKALDDFRIAIKVDPKYARPYLARAWLFATCPDKRFRDGKLAVESATQACELTRWRESNKLAVLAAGYAEWGDFEKAIRWQKEAIKRAVDPIEAKKGREWLELYKRKQPCRVADAPDPDRAQGDGARDSSETNRWSRFPDPELARRVFAELEERIGKLTEGAKGRDGKPSPAKVSSIMEIVARRHHLKPSEVRAIWRAGDETAMADPP